jgi:hypothetical protein
MSSSHSALQRLGSRFTLVLVIVAVSLVILEFVIHRHGEIAAEDFPIFPAIYGFLAFLFIVQVGKWLRLLIMRREDYYDE